MSAHELRPLRIPDDFWARETVRAALCSRDVGRLFRLLRRYAGASQSKIGTAVGLEQGNVSKIASGQREVVRMDVLERIANGLDMPNESRGLFGLAPPVERPPLATGGGAARPATRARRAVLGQVDDENRPHLEGVVAPAGVADRAIQAGHTGDTEQLLGWSADQSADHGLAFAARAALALDGQMMSDTFEEVRRIARAYASEQRWQTFIRARSVRDLAFDLSERTRRPHDIADAYLLASLSSLLMSSAAFDLAYPNAAWGLARAARTLAGLSRHAEAEAWALGLLATLLNWQDQPAEALVLLEQSRQTALGVASRYRLNHIAARSHAILGDRRATEDALTEALNNPPDEESGGLLQDEIGGEFRFDYARASACAGSAWLRIGDGGAAKGHLCHALDAYQTLPATQRPWAPVNGARVDLAAAFVLDRDLDGAGETIEPIFRLPHTQRISTISGRLAALRGELRKPQHRRDPRAMQLDGRIDEWVHGSS